MGAANSSAERLSNNQYLRSFCSEESYSTGNTFWRRMLSSKALHCTLEDQDDVKSAEEACAELLGVLGKNNLHTRNVQSLERVIGILLKEQWSESNISALISGLVLYRFVLKHFLAVKDLENLRPLVLGNDPPFDEFVHCLISSLSRADVSYHLHLIVEMEAILLLILSTERFGIEQPIVDRVTHLVFDHNSHDLQCFTNVMLNILKVFCVQSITTEKDSLTTGSRIAGGIYKIVTLSWLYTSSPANDSFAEACLLSAHLFCLLGHWPVQQNPYRTAIREQLNFDSSLKGNGTTDLFQNLCHPVYSEHGIVVLYTLLYRSKRFKTFFLSRANLDEMVQYILRVIYEVQCHNPHHHSMCLIVLLVLSEDKYFTNYLQNTGVAVPAWYKDRNLNSMTMANFVYIVVAKQISRNIVKSKDRYLNNNCIGIMCNLAHGFVQMHWFVSHKLMDLIRLALRRFEAANVGERDDDELAVTEELLKMLVEIVNIIICGNPVSNIALIYSILYESKLMERLKDNLFSSSLDDILKISSYLTESISKIEEPTEEELKSVLETKLKLFPLSSLAAHSDIRFEYKEQDDSSRFFMPYLWALVYDSKYLGQWPSEEFKLFNYKE